MTTIFADCRTNQFRFLLIATAVAAVMGCSGGSSSDDATAAPPEIVAPFPDPGAADPPTQQPPYETPPVVVAPNEPDVDVDKTPPPSLTFDPYDRPYDYPNLTTLPLEYFPTTNGKLMGVRVTLPADESGNPLPGPFPTILIQTGYNMYTMSLLTVNGGAALAGMRDPYFVRHGYAVVVVDVYGTGVSQGGWVMFGEEEQAGYRDSVEWVKQQPWYDGNLGVAGTSYLAISALFTAALKPDDVKAVFAAAPMGDAQRGTVGQGGLFNAVFMSFWMSFTQNLATVNGIAQAQNPDLASIIKSATQEHEEQSRNVYVPLFNDYMEGDPQLTYASDFWLSRSPFEQADNIRAPTIITGALQDIFQRDEPLWYEKLRKNVDTRLFVYDSDHIRNLFQLVSGVDAVDPMASLMLRWFDKYLKGYDSKTEQIPQVTQYVKNYKEGVRNGFVSTTDWPHPEMQPQRLFLHGDMTVDTLAPTDEEESHTLDAAPQPTVNPGDDSKTLYTITLNDGTRCSVSYRQWTLGSASLIRSDGISPGDTCYIENTVLETGALNFETAAMPEDYYLNGPIQADIWIETSGENAILSVWIDEVSPSGVSMPISNGILLASARAVDESRSRFINGMMIQPFHYLTQEAEQPVVPGEVFKMQVEIFPTSYIVRKGYKLRVSIASSNQAEGILNYPRQQQVIGSTMTVHSSARFPSSIVVPSVPTSILP